MSSLGQGIKITPLALEGLKLVELKIFGDARGFFVERYRRDKFVEAGITNEFVQDNHSRSAPGVLRGLHYQSGGPNGSLGQGKLVGALTGRIWDVAVDLRSGSKTFGQSFGVELSDTNGLLLWVPAGFAHGFCVLGDQPADVLYKVDQPYDPSREGGVLWNDPTLAVKWPLGAPLVSARDEKLATFADYRARPVF